MQNSVFLEGRILPNIFSLNFSVCNLNRSTFKSGKINQIKAQRKGMLSLVTGKTPMPDCAISNIRIGQGEFGSGD